MSHTFTWSQAVPTELSTIWDNFDRHAAYVVVAFVAGG